MAGLIEKLEKQHYGIHKIIIVNTEAEYINQEDLLRKFEKLEIHNIKKEQFNHGLTRNYGASFSKADYIVFMTQDAVPADGNLIGNMLKYMGKEKTATVYGRQLPNKDCNQLEKYTRSFNYGEKSKVKSIKDLDKMGIKNSKS